MIPHIVLTGYYGFGNLGDDLLCVCTLRIARQLFPNAKISIFTWSKHADYLRELFPEPIDIHAAKMPSADLIVHGGGGVFFDFADGPFSASMINSVIKLIGVYRYRKVVGWLNRNVRKRVQDPRRIGLGLGVGRYTNSSRRFFTDVLTMTDFSYLMVRDQESVDNLAIVGVTNANVGTDLVFGYDFSNVPGNQEEANEIAFVLRDWTYDNTYLTHWLDIAEQLVNAGYPVRILSFDQKADQEYLRRFSGYNQSIWNPAVNADIRAYLGQLRRAKVIVSSRAHGVVVAAGLGVPSLCIEIEPKLRTIAAMLPNSTSLIGPESDSSLVIPRIIQMYQASSDYDRIETDITRNQQILSTSVSEVANFLSRSKLRK